MSRAATDPRVREMMALFEETLAISNEQHRRQGTRRQDYSEGMLDHFVHYIAMCSEEVMDGWPDEALRAITLVFAQHAPADAFKRMLDKARENIVTDREYIDSVRKEAAEAATATVQ